MATLLAAAASATASALATASPRNEGTPAGGFGGPTAVHIAQVGHIDVDLETSAPAGLQQVRCAVKLSAGATCYVASP
ncbi:MAG TPA: hypothetical protein VGG88_02000 [Gaiellaceae bacterium]